MEPTTTIILTFIGVLVIGAAKYYERKYGNNPEAWDNQKFGIFVIVAGIIMVLEYSYTAAVSFPADEILDPLLQLMTPIFTLFGATYSAIVGGKLVKSTIIAPATTIAAAIAPEDIDAFGFKILPSFLEGKSPFLAVAQVTCSQTVSGMTVDWKDGSAIQAFTFTPDGEYYTASIGHQYTFTGDGKYTGHTFYPEITLIGKNGKKQTFNTELSGRCWSVYVQA
jgi:hypothetical protein